MIRLSDTDIVYISGPMTGLPEFNYPAFHAAEAELLSTVGCRVINPARQPEQLCWIDYMRQDIILLCEATAVLLLPGHEASRGARLEVHIATELGLQIVEH